LPERFFARTILHRIILRSKKLHGGGKFLLFFQVFFTHSGKFEFGVPFSPAIRSCSDLFSSFIACFYLDMFMFLSVEFSSTGFQEKNFIDKLLGRRIFRLNEKITVALRRRIIRAKNYPAKNFPPKRKNIGSSLAKNFPSEESSSEEFSPSRVFFERRIIRRRKQLAKNTPSEESSGRRILRRRIFRPNKKITAAKNSPTKNYNPSEELSGEELTREVFS
jgi:hypothetical protein